MSTEISTLLENAINQLLAENKKPSVALVKTKLTEPVPMPLIIKALQRWKQFGQVPKIDVSEKTLSSEERIALLEKQVSELTARLTLLEAILENPKKD